MVLTSLPRENQSHACPAKGLEALFFSLHLSPGLAMIRAQFTPCLFQKTRDCSKALCQVCQSGYSTPRPPCHTPAPASCLCPRLISTPPAVGQQGALIKEGELLGLESVPEPAPCCSLWPGQVSGCCWGAWAGPWKLWGSGDVCGKWLLGAACKEAEAFRRI